MLDLKSLIPFQNKSKQVAQTTREPAMGDPFVSFRKEVDQLFDTFFQNGAVMPRSTDWNSAVPKLEVNDGEKNLTILAELPGMEEKDVDVRISGDLLTIEGEKSEEREEKNGARTYSERSYGKFSRTIRLPFTVGNEKVDATFDKGVLTINLEKPAEQQQKIKHIEIKAA